MLTEFILAIGKGVGESEAGLLWDRCRVHTHKFAPVDWLWAAVQKVLRKQKAETPGVQWCLAKK